jgi:hydroxymethylpyrimidine pyrophosphatase-like HAD family hydrolase
MPLAPDTLDTLRDFVAASGFARRGAIVTDLDGTAVHEFEGRAVVPEPVEAGLKRLHDGGHPFVINSLRFPLSVMRTFGRAWTSISNAPIPTVALNGSLVGHVLVDERDRLVFREVDAFVLLPAEIDEALRGVEGMLRDGVRDLLVFFYPRDWTVGELIWTPDPARIEAVHTKYRSATQVMGTSFEDLRTRLHSMPICMIFLLIDLPQDQLMAYQHTKRSSFITHAGVDKLHGARELTARLGYRLEQCIGAGDAELDTFLGGVGLAVIVGNAGLAFKGRHATVRLATSLELGELLFNVAELAKLVGAAHAGHD